MAGKWVPRTEKSFLIGIISAGGQLGPVTGMLLSGSLTSAFGWEVRIKNCDNPDIQFMSGFPQFLLLGGFLLPGIRDRRVVRLLRLPCV